MNQTAVGAIRVAEGLRLDFWRNDPWDHCDRRPRVGRPLGLEHWRKRRDGVVIAVIDDAVMGVRGINRVAMNKRLAPNRSVHVRRGQDGQRQHGNYRADGPADAQDALFQQGFQYMSPFVVSVKIRP